MWNTEIHFALIRVNEGDKGHPGLWAQVAVATGCKKRTGSIELVRFLLDHWMSWNNAVRPLPRLKASGKCHTDCCLKADNNSCRVPSSDLMGLLSHFLKPILMFETFLLYE